MKCAIYARVSTDRQCCDGQLETLRVFALQRGFEVFEEYVDTGFSGMLDSRPALNKMMKDAKRRLFKAVIVMKFDRFARSVKHLVTSLDEFDHLGIAFISYTESMDTSSPMGRAMFSVIAAMSQLERDLIAERVRAGVKRAREKKGGKWGRPAINFVDPGGSVRHAMEITGVSRETVRRNRLKAGYRYVQVEVPDVTPPEQP